MNVKITKQSPFSSLSSPTRKEEPEKRDLLRKVWEYLMKKDLGIKDDNTWNYALHLAKGVKQ